MAESQKLTQALKDVESLVVSTREKALGVLVTWDDQSEEAREALLRAADDPIAGYRQIVAIALMGSPMGPASMPLFLKLLADPDPSVTRSLIRPHFSVHEATIATHEEAFVEAALQAKTPVTPAMREVLRDGIAEFEPLKLGPETARTWRIMDRVLQRVQGEIANGRAESLSQEVSAESAPARRAPAVKL